MSVQQRVNEVARAVASGFIIVGMALLVASILTTIDRVWIDAPLMLARIGFYFVWLGSLSLASFVLYDWLSGWSDEHE